MKIKFLKKLKLKYTRPSKFSVFIKSEFCENISIVRTSVECHMKKVSTDYIQQPSLPIQPWGSESDIKTLLIS